MLLPIRWLCCASLLATTAQAQVCPAGPLALVLSGGGAKGFAHIGVMRALDRRGVHPDLVVGSSIGAIMGALYASGLSGDQVDSVTRPIPAADIAGPLANRAPHNWGDLTPLLLWEQGAKRFTLVTGGESERRTNALLNRLLLRANLRAGGDFDRLPIRFRAVATDLETREAVALSEGDLAQAVRASSAIPLVLSPVRIGGRVLADGGISANMPVAAARAAGAARVVVVDLHEELDPNGTDIASAAGVAGQLAAFLFRQPPDSLGPDDVWIHPDVAGFANLDFASGRREQLIENGYRAADSVLARSRCLPQGPAPAVGVVPSYLGGWEVANGSARDGETMGRVLGLTAGKVIDLPALGAQLAEAANLEVFRQLWLGPVGTGDTTFFRAQIVPAARRVAGLGVAYDHDLGGRLWFAGLDRTAIRGAEVSGIVTLGRFKSEFLGALSSHLGVGRVSVSPTGSMHLALEEVRRFDDQGRNFEKEETREASGALGLEWARLGSWRLTGGGTGVFWRTPEGEDHSTGGVFLVAATEPAIPIRARIELLSLGDFQLARGEAGADLTQGRLTVSPSVRAGVGRRLPLQRTFELGGPEGFPGLQMGERRGDRELEAAVQTAWQLRGPVALRLLVAAGRSADGGALFDRSRWLGGLRFGVGAATPVGPVNFEYGVASNGERGAFIRVGRWF